MRKYYLAALLGVILTAVGQLLFKLGANQALHGGFMIKILHPFCLLGYAILFVVTLMNLYAYKVLPLKVSVVLLPLTTILVCIFSLLFLKEQATANQFVGAGLIVCGIFVFNLNRT